MSIITLKDRVKTMQSQKEHIQKQLVILAAAVAHEVNRAYCRALGDDSQVAWNNAPEWQKGSCIEGVVAIVNDPAITPAQQHECWLTVKQREGWVYGEVKDADKKTHPCMKSYDELTQEQKIKDHLFGAAVRGVLGLKQLSDQTRIVMS